MVEIVLKEIFSDEETLLAKAQIKEKVSEIFDGIISFDEKRDTYWFQIVEPGWSSESIKRLVNEVGEYTEAILEFENQLFEDVLREMGYGITEFC